MLDALFAALGAGMVCIVCTAHVVSRRFRKRTAEVIRGERALLEDEKKTLNTNDGFQRSRYRNINRQLVHLYEEEAALSERTRTTAWKRILGDD